MTTLDFYRAWERATGRRTPGKMSNIRRALAFHGLFTGHSPITPESAAWLVVASIAGPSPWEQAKDWVLRMQVFFHNMRQANEPTALSFFAAAFADEKIADLIESTLIDPYTLAVVIQVGGEPKTVTKMLPNPPDDARAYPLFFVPGQLIRELGEEIRAAVVDDVARQN